MPAAAAIACKQFNGGKGRRKAAREEGHVTEEEEEEEDGDFALLPTNRNSVRR